MQINFTEVNENKTKIHLTDIIFTDRFLKKFVNLEDKTPEICSI